MLVGKTSGAALQGALNLKAQLSEGTIVVVFPDGSDRYVLVSKYLIMRRMIMNKKTKLIHGGHTTNDYTGAVTTPIYQTSTYLQDDIGDLRQGYEYSCTANPTRSSVESVIAALENGKHGFAFSSGVAAISAVVMLLDKG